MSKGLSPAARGQRRGVLEVLKEPPALFTVMSEHGDKHVPAVNTYSLLGLAVTIPVVSTQPDAASFSTVTMILLLFVFICSFLVSVGIGLLGDIESNKKHLTRRIRNTAENKLIGNDVSLSNGVSRIIDLDELTFRQKKWINKKWHKELNAAIDRKQGTVLSGEQELDRMVDDEHIKQISMKLNELEKIRKQSRISDAERFDAEVNRLSA